MAGEARPPRVRPRIRFAPRIRQIYWSDFPDDAQLPEFWKRRPVLVISRRSVLSGHFIGLPITTVEQGDNHWAYEITSPFNGKPCWVVCDHIVTMACSRLHPHKMANPRLNQDDFQAIIQIMSKALPRLST